MPDVESRLRSGADRPTHQLVADLNRTIAALWWIRAVGTRTGQRAHWRTREAYYAAVTEIVATDPAATPTWRATVAAVRPRGSRSTFYEVAGQRAKQPLLAEYRLAGTADALQIALLYRRSSAAESLLDEAKVWAFWPFRQVCLHRLATSPAPAEAYLEAVTEWARHNPSLAEALDFAPPACAVEDLVTIHNGFLPALRAHAILQRTLAQAVGARPGLRLPAAP